MALEYGPEARAMAKAVYRLVDVGILGRDAHIIARCADALQIPRALVTEAYREAAAAGGYIAPDVTPIKQPEAPPRPKPTPPPPAAPPETGWICKRPSCDNDAPSAGTYCSVTCERAHEANPGERRVTPAMSAANAANSKQSDAWKRAHPNGEGTRRCARCQEVKADDEFPVKNHRTGQRRSYCIPCYKEQARERHLSVSMRDQLGGVGLEFKITDGDDITLHCSECDKPLVVGDLVNGESVLRHANCDDALADRPDTDLPDLGVAILQELSRREGEIYDPSGHAVRKLMEQIVHDYDDGSVRNLLAVLSDEGYIQRTTNGRRTSRICLLGPGQDVVDQAVADID